jgi:phospholipase/carboxylesterase
MNFIPHTIDINPPGSGLKASVIWLHGLGADGNDFVPMVEQLNLVIRQKVRFVFPHAPLRSITVNSGMRMRAWYDIFELNLSRCDDLKGIQESETLINLLIEREISLGVPSHQIILGGFSQGGAISLYTGLRYPTRLGGIIALSAYMPAADVFSEARSLENTQTPIFMAHGLSDSVVPFMLGNISRQQLEGLNYPVEWRSYPMAHTVVQEEIEDISRFIQTIVNK